MPTSCVKCLCICVMFQLFCTVLWLQENIQIYIENTKYNLGEQRNIKTFHSKNFLTAHFLAVKAFIQFPFQGCGAPDFLFFFLEACIRSDLAARRDTDHSDSKGFSHATVTLTIHVCKSTESLCAARNCQKTWGKSQGEVWRNGWTFWEILLPGCESLWERGTTERSL